MSSVILNSSQLRCLNEPWFSRLPGRKPSCSRTSSFGARGAREACAALERGCVRLGARVKAGQGKGEVLYPPYTGEHGSIDGLSHFGHTAGR